MTGPVSPAAPKGDWESVPAVSREVQGPVTCGLARCPREDIELAPRALADAPRKRIHVFLATSAIHRQYKLNMAEEEILRAAVEGVRRARELCEDVEFSPEDASRTELEFLAQVVESAIEAGASTVNIPDTVGYALPHDFGVLIAEIVRRVGDDVMVSVHCHNDLGLAVANSIEAVRNGARQIEVAVNGIGERAGNCSMEEVVMALATRSDLLDRSTQVVTPEIARTSRLVTALTGYPVQFNKAVVGRNAFAHESGIHQDGVLKERSTYEIMDATTVGLDANSLVLGKHSGRHALREALQELGFSIDGQALNTAFKRFKEIADKKKQVTAMDLEALVTDELRSGDLGAWALEDFSLKAGRNHAQAVAWAAATGSTARTSSWRWSPWRADCGHDDRAVRDPAIRELAAIEPAGRIGSRSDPHRQLLRLLRRPPLRRPGDGRCGACQGLLLGKYAVLKVLGDAVDGLHS